jgi:hypothetical protein
MQTSSVVLEKCILEEHYSDEEWKQLLIPKGWFDSSIIDVELSKVRHLQSILCRHPNTSSYQTLSLFEANGCISISIKTYEAPHYHSYLLKH